MKKIGKRILSLVLVVCIIAPSIIAVANESIIDKLDEYKVFIEEKKELIRLELENFSYYSTSEFMQKMYDATNNILSATHETLHMFSKVDLPRLSKAT